MNDNNDKYVHVELCIHVLVNVYIVKLSTQGSLK